MTEREFVLNNINKYEGIFSKEELNVHLKYVKDLYKTICENTSDGKTVTIEVKKIDDIITYISENATASIERNVVPMFGNLKKGG